MRSTVPQPPGFLLQPTTRLQLFGQEAASLVHGEITDSDTGPHGPDSHLTPRCWSGMASGVAQGDLTVHGGIVFLVEIR